ncbi:serine/threonine-protein kinase [Nakamurella alba]|uniref:serine/threonine-protein kinase n=1 Tax=Nakamurella alba TaxID=2665158 RepID=UPI0018AA5EBC|nr:serine/threonine-protein kinase [Nakamurella alba]
MTAPPGPPSGDDAPRRAFPQVPGVRLDAEVGRGGFATVYRGHQLSVDRDVAVKVDDRRLVDERDRRRFTREIIAAGAVAAHPHIVTLYDGGTTADDHPYLVMELYTGGSYAERIKKSGPVPADEVLDIGFAIADALVAAHGEGILHRDVKPGNILISRYGNPALTDFGLAALPPAGEQYSVTMDSLTPSYAAPEAFGGVEPTASMDIYALGATLYAMLLGRPPRSDPNGASPPLTKLLVLLNEPLPPAGVEGAEDLMPVIWRATAVLPGDRYPTAAAFRDALAAVRAGHPEQAGGLRPFSTPAPVPPGRTDERADTGRTGGSGGSVTQDRTGQGLLDDMVQVSAQRSGRRRPWPVIAAAAVVLALVIGAAVMLGREAAVGGDARIAGGGASSSTAGSLSVTSASPSSVTTSGSVTSSQGSVSTPPSTPTTAPSTPTTAPSTPTTAPSTPTTTTPTTVVINQTPPPVGTCFTNLVTIGSRSTATALDSCDEPHGWEAYGTGVLAATTRSPGLVDVAKDPNVVKTCTQDTLVAYLPPNTSGSFDVRILPPSETDFVLGERGFWCIARIKDSGEVTGSLARG